MILMNDFKAEPEELIQSELGAVERVLRSGWYVLGAEVKAFESVWAKYCGLGYAVGVGNGMDAIEIGLRALGIGEGDEVITTPMTAFATVLAVMRAGATPVLADIDPSTGLLSMESVERCISRNTKAVLLVHLYGQVRAMDEWLNLSERTGIALLEDCAQAHGAKWRGVSAGGFGRWGAYSFYPTKNLGTAGDGGALITNDVIVAEKSAVLRNYGQSQRYHHPELGMNSRLDELHAALLQVRLPMLDGFTQRRQSIAAQYQAGIINSRLSLLAKPVATENHVYHLFVLRTDARDELNTYLKNASIDSLSHYPIPIHHQSPCVSLRRDPAGLKHAELHAQTCLSLPCHPFMSDADVDYVIENINAF
jgi:dTDP-4-amino-4,6-dideoxygalactose transaminase